MNSIRMVATVSCALMFGMISCGKAHAQTRMTLSQYRAAQARAAQQRAAQQRALQQRSVAQPVRSTTRYIPGNMSTTTRSTAPKSEPTEIFKDKVPDAALLTDRGTELASRLKSLRYAEATLGAKHPSMESVREQIVSIKRELKAWSPVPSDDETDEELVKKKDDATEKVEETLATLNESDLRQLVVRLSVDVSELRQRVSRLEAAQERMSKRNKEDSEDVDQK